MENYSYLDEQVASNPEFEEIDYFQEMLKSNDQVSILQEINQSPSELPKVLTAAISVLQADDSNPLHKIFALEVLQVLLREYKHPIALKLNSPNFELALSMAHAQGSHEEVKNVLDLALSLFIFDKNRSMLYYLANFYRNLFGQNVTLKFDGDINPPDFVKCYIQA